MKVNYFHVCELAFIADDNKTLSIIRIFQFIDSQGFPTVHPRFSIAFNVSGDPGEHSYELKILTPDRVSSIAELKNSFEIQRDDAPVNLINHFIGLMFPSEGKYLIQLEIDGKVIVNDDSQLILRKIE